MAKHKSTRKPSTSNTRKTQLKQVAACQATVVGESAGGGAANADANSVVAFTRHDHRRCKRTAMRAVVSLCEARKIRLTPVRERTLDILLESHNALGAYEVLEKLAVAGFGEKPPVVYRALGFLMEQGFVHKLEKLNAYVACVEPGVCAHPCLMVCKLCGRVAEQSVPDAGNQLTAAANQLGFSTAASVMELSGVCSQCPVQPW